MVILGMEIYINILILVVLIFISILLLSIVYSNEKSKKIFEDWGGGLPPRRLIFFSFVFFAVLGAFGYIVGFAVEWLIKEIITLYNNFSIY
ncbi:hypothetical protein OAJ30_03900 [Alphaproteobacteria bacterium]|nr:hypothetical protein [Alphaproteobacteria bacterium]